MSGGAGQPVALEQPLLILDGGMGHLLTERGVGQGVNGPKLFLGGGMANKTSPRTVVDIHEEFLRAGADVLTTNNFGVTPWSLAPNNMGDQLFELTEAAGLVAWEAAHGNAEKPALVAGSLPPLKEAYQTTDLGDAEIQQPIYEEIAAALAPHVDVLLCETMATLSQTWAAATAASATGKPFWVSWTLVDQQGPPILRGGEPLEAAVRAISTFPGLHAVLVNCCAPQAVSAAMPVLRQTAPDNVRVGGYANGFQTSTSEWLSKGHVAGIEAAPADYENGIITPEAAARHAVQWVRAGASIVGGCCGMGPKHIAAISEALKGPKP